MIAGPGSPSSRNDEVSGAELDHVGGLGIDEVRIKKVWEMNETEAKELVKKIMHCDQVIHEQQLNVGWKMPSDKFFEFLHDNTTHGATNSGTGDSSFKGADSETQGKSQMNQNTSLMATSSHSEAQIIYGGNPQI